MDQSTCLVGGTEPLVLSWTNNQVSPDVGSAISRGIAAQIGEDAQLFSLRPAVSLTNTFVVHASLCNDNDKNYTCIANAGGVYTPGLDVKPMNSWDNWNGTHSDDVAPDADFTNIFYNDELQIGGHELHGFPFYSYLSKSSGASASSCLAIGSNSSFLEAAVQGKIIPTKQWSLWPGSGTHDEKIDGSLILGGYDEDRAAGDFVSVPMRNNHMLVEVTGLSWQSATGSTTNMMPEETTSFDALLEPFTNWLNLPSESLAIFYNATNATSGNSTSYEWHTRPQGALTIALSNGIEANIPASDIFDYRLEWTEQGVLEVSDRSSSLAWMMGDSLSSGTPFLIGLPFLAQKYIIADFDGGRYHVADANKQSFGNSPTRVGALCTGGPTPTSIPTQPPKTNVAAIAGGVGGGVGALILGVIAFCLIRRRKRRSQQQPQSPHPPEIAEPSIRSQTTSSYPQGGMSPPPKYPISEVYETNLSSKPTIVNAQSQYGSSMPTSPRSDAGTSHWGHLSVDHSQTSQFNADNISAGDDINRYSSISPYPVEMPTDGHAHRSGI